MKPQLLAIPAAALLLAACGSSTPSPQSLASKIPGCSGILVITPAAIELQDVACNLGGAQVDIGSFANSGDEQEWIQDGGTPGSPDPSAAECCIEGDDWAATVGAADIRAQTIDADMHKVIAAIGGKKVSG